MGHANASALGTLVERTTPFTLLVPLKSKDATTVRRPSLSGANLLIAGTASVVGHISAHIGKPQKQTLEILHNLTTLIAHTEQLHGADQSDGMGMPSSRFIFDTRNMSRRSATSSRSGYLPILRFCIFKGRCAEASYCWRLRASWAKNHPLT